jgi:hypothetical protein
MRQHVAYRYANRRLGLLKNMVLGLSLIGNLLGIYLVFSPSEFFIYKTTSAPKMTCSEALRSPVAATLAFSKAHGGSLFKTQNFLLSSDFHLRNIAMQDGQATFVYTATTYPTACGWYFTPLYGGIVRVQTNLATDPVITAAD